MENDKVFHVAQVIEHEKYYEIEKVIENRMKKFADKSNNQLGLNDLTAHLIETKGQEFVIRIVKDFKGQEVMPYDLLILNKEMMNTNNLEFIRTLYIQKARMQTTLEQSIISGIHLYDYININNILNDKGYHIHDDNKEEKYLEILETGDEDLIDKLEIYLNARDIVSRSSFVEHLYLKLYTNMKESESEEEIVQFYIDFLNKIAPTYD